MNSTKSIITSLIIDGSLELFHSRIRQLSSFLKEIARNCFDSVFFFATLNIDDNKQMDLNCLHCGPMSMFH